MENSAQIFNLLSDLPGEMTEIDVLLEVLIYDVFNISNNILYIYIYIYHLYKTKATGRKGLQVTSATGTC